MFIDAYLKLCKEKGISPSSLAVQLGIGKGAYSNWKKGSEPINKTKKIIADYFGITVEELESGQINKPVTNNDDGLNNLDNDLKALLKSLRPGEVPQARAFVQGLIAARKE